MLTNIRYIILTALRDWLFAGLMLAVLACVLISHMLGGIALIENQEMTLAYASMAARGVIVAGLIIFACFHVRNAFDTKEIDVFLSRPITRMNLVLSYWLGFATVSIGLVIPAVILIALQGVIDVNGFVFWSFSLLVECWLTVAISILAAFSIASPVTSALVTLGIYIVARMTGFFIAISSINPIFTNILPRIDFFAKSEWLIYGVQDNADLKLFLLQACIYIPILIFFAIAGFRRKQF